MPDYNKNLRERDFGEFDKTALSNLTEIWNQDKRDANHSYKGVESPNKVLKRTVVLINALEEKYRGKKILLVSHGDVLQILYAYFLKKPVSHHRQISHLKTAEIRELKV